MIKRLITVVLFSALAAIQGAGQNRFPPINLVAGDPTGTACPAHSMVQSSDSGILYTCQAGAYHTAGGQTIPVTAVTWPPSCTTGTYVPATNTCVPTGTAANPGGTAGQTQINAGGSTFIGIAGSMTDSTYGWKTQGGTQYAKGWQSGAGNNGIVNASAANQIVIADPTYATTEQPGPFSFAVAPFHFQDLRLGQKTDFYRNAYQTLFNFGVYPLNRTYPAATNTYCLYDQQSNPSSTSGSGTCEVMGQQNNAPGYSYGNFGGTYTGWAGGHMSVRVFQTRQSGINDGMYLQQNKYGLGDHIGIGALLYNHGGMTATSDEGQEAGNFQSNEDIPVFSSTCSTGCTTGSQSIKTPAANSTQGPGRYLLDATPAVAMTGQITNIGTGIGGASAYTITGVSATPSTAWGTIATAAQTPLPTAPPFTSDVTFTVTVTSGTFNTTDLMCFSGNFHEQVVPYSVTNGAGPTATIKAFLRRSHITGAVMQGGPCGQGIEIPAFTYGIYKYLFDVIGATDASTLQVVRFIGGTAGINIIPAAIYQTQNFTSATMSGGTTVTFVGTSGGTMGTTAWRIMQGGSILFSGSSDSALNAVCTNVQWTAPSITSTGTCTIAGLSGTHTTTTPMSATLVSNGVTINSFNTYYIAEVTDVQNEALNPPLVDGTLALEPNLLPLAPGHTITETHHYSAGYVAVKAVTNTQNPWNRLTTIQITNSGKGTSAFSDINNAAISYLNGEPLATYLGYGGNLNAPPVLYTQGPFTNLIQTHDPPTNGGTVIAIGNNTSYSNIASSNMNLFTVAGKSATWSANFNLFNGDVTESVPRVFTISGLVNFASPTFGAQTNVLPITFALMTTPTLTVTCATTGGQLAAGTYAYRIQARGGSFFSAQGAEVTGTVASGTTGSCNLSWNPVAGATTSYLISGRTAGSTAQIVAVQNGIGGTTYTDVGVITPSGSPQVTVQPGVDTAGSLGMLSSGTAFELKLQAPASMAATTTITVTKISGVSITPAAVTASTCAEQTFNTYTGLATTQVVNVSPPSFLGAHVWIASSRVSAANTLAIAFCADATGGTPAAGVYLAMAF